MEKFWNKYLEADLLQRLEIVKPITKRLQDLSNVPFDSEEHEQAIWCQNLVSYFDDLIEVINNEG